MTGSMKRAVLSPDERRRRARESQRRYYHERGGKERQREYYDQPHVTARRNVLSAQYAATAIGKQHRKDYVARNPDWYRAKNRRWMRVKRNRCMPLSKAIALWILAYRAVPLEIIGARRFSAAMGVVFGVMDGLFLAREIPALASEITAASRTLFAAEPGALT